MKRRNKGCRSARSSGVALLEVVLAITIFALTALFVLAGLSSSMDAVGRARIEADAEDAAATVLSRLRMGAFPLQSAPPTPIHEEYFPGWTYELVVTGLEETQDWPTLKRVEVILRNEELSFTHRIHQRMLDEPLEEEPQ